MTGLTDYGRGWKAGYEQAEKDAYDWWGLAANYCLENHEQEEEEAQGVGTPSEADVD